MAKEPLPQGWKGVMRDQRTRAAAFLQEQPGLPPLFIVKVSQRVNVSRMAVGFGRINIYSYFGGEYVLSCLLLIDGGPHLEEVECLFNAANKKDCAVLSTLGVSQTVDVAFVIDNTKMSFLGTKRISWPEQKRTRVLLLLATPFVPKGKRYRHTWNSLVEAHRLSLDAHRFASSSVSEASAFPSPPGPLPVSVPTGSLSSSLSTASRQEVKEAMTRPLLIDRYLFGHPGALVPQERTLDRYLWMQSAWLMADALRHGITSPVLHLPKRALYIELEHPQHLYQQEVAAFSLTPYQTCWVFTVLNSDGQAVWAIHYEQAAWTLPRDYQCPEQSCSIVIDGEDRSYLLCTHCQQRMNHYPAWLVVALRMINGDFRTQVTLQQPEVIIESGHYTVREGRDGSTSTRQTRHTFRVIRSFDASISGSSTSHGRRGSWMQGRPLATGADALNPNAIVYVQIQPDAYERRYVHDRYIHAKGTVQHIEPGPRLQPMTVAAFQQLGTWHFVTRVAASRYEEQAREKE